MAEENQNQATSSTIAANTAPITEEIQSHEHQEEGEDAEAVIIISIPLLFSGLHIFKR